jgi:hypothetical protein
MEHLNLFYWYTGAVYELNEESQTLAEKEALELDCCNAMCAVEMQDNWEYAWSNAVNFHLPF